MGSGDTVTLTLTGGGPWGFRLMGGDTFPIQVAKVRKKSKASLGGLEEGDRVISINGVNLVGRSHEDAMHHVDNSGETLTIEVQRSAGTTPLQAESEQQSAPVEQQVTVVNGYEPDQPVVSTTTESYSVDGDNVRTDVVKTEQQEVSEDGSAIKTITTKQVTTVAAAGSQPASVTQQTLHVKYSGQSDQGKENIAPMTGMFSQNKWNQVPQFNVRNIKNTLKPAVQGNVQVIQHSLSPVPKPSVFKAATPAERPQQLRAMSPSSLMSPVSSSPLPHQMRQPSPVAQMRQPSPVAQMRQPSPVAQMRQPSPVDQMRQPSPVAQIRHASPMPSPMSAPATFAPPSPVMPEYQPPPPPPPPMPSIIPESELYFEVPKPRMPKPEKKQAEEKIKEEIMEEIPEAELMEHHHHQDHHEHLPIFAPPVEFYPEDFDFPDTTLSEGAPDLDMRRIQSLESEGSYEGSRAYTTKRKKLYSDSAFYDDPTANYPTIRDQIQLCKQIAKSLTSAANKKARGARMFAKRKHKSSRWIHDGAHLDSYSAGDVEDLVDLDTEFFIDEGGSKPLFSFRIPNIKKRIANPESDLKMSLTQDQFERLRLGSQKTDHRAVSPSTCHSLVADLHSKKNRGAKLFQKRQARSEKWVIDESNVQSPVSTPTRLEAMLSPSEKGLSPWEAAMQSGSVDAAFANRGRQEQLKKYNPPMQKYNPPMQPVQFSHPVSTPYQQPQQNVVKHKLKTEEQLNLITGPTYNRLPRGWGASEDVIDTRSLDRKVMRSQERTSKQAPPPPPPPPPKPPKPQDNYNRKIRAWGNNDDDGVQSSWNSTQHVQYEPYRGGPGQPQGYKMTQSYNYQMSSAQQQPSFQMAHAQQQPMMLPGSDL